MKCEYEQHCPHIPCSAWESTGTISRNQNVKQTDSFSPLYTPNQLSRSKSPKNLSEL